MTISSRTPEGVPYRCPICGKASALEPSYPGGDACCPSCGQLLWWFRDHLGLATIEPSSSFVEDVEMESIDLVELVMELEEKFDINVPDEVAERIRTVGDAIRYIEERLPG